LGTLAATSSSPHAKIAVRPCEGRTVKDLTHGPIFRQPIAMAAPIAAGVTYLVWFTPGLALRFAPGAM